MQIGNNKRKFHRRLVVNKLYIKIYRYIITINVDFQAPKDVKTLTFQNYWVTDQCFNILRDDMGEAFGQHPHMVNEFETTM